jgi:hypothetical protein
LQIAIERVGPHTIRWTAPCGLPQNEHFTSAASESPAFGRVLLAQLSSIH